MNNNKRRFQVRDIVVPSNRCPKWLLALIRRNRSRTVVDFYYDKTQQHTLYFVGTNRMGFSDFTALYPFRAEQLKPYIPKPIGRPYSKRKYRKRGALNH